MKTLIAVLMIGTGVGAVAWVVAIKHPDADIVVSGRQLFDFADASGLRKTSSAEVPKEAAAKSQPAVAQVREPRKASQRQSASNAQSVRLDPKPKAKKPAGNANVTIQIAPASKNTQRLAADTKDDDPATQAARRAAKDPYPDASTYRLIESVRLGNELEWEQAFSIDMQLALGNAVVPENVPFEYPPNPRAIPDGFRIVQILANAVRRAGLPCKSIYTVDSIEGFGWRLSIDESKGLHGWVLSCEQGQHHYGVALIEKDWMLGVIK